MAAAMVTPVEVVLAITLEKLGQVEFRVPAGGDIRVSAYAFCERYDVPKETVTYLVAAAQAKARAVIQQYVDAAVEALGDDAGDADGVPGGQADGGEGKRTTASAPASVSAGQEVPATGLGISASGGGVSRSRSAGSDSVGAAPQVVNGVDFSAAGIDLRGEIPLESSSPRRNLAVEFTCNKCGGRTAKMVSRHAYTKGCIFVTCDHCEVQHRLVDRLKVVEEYNYAREEWVDVNKGVPDAPPAPGGWVAAAEQERREQAKRDARDRKDLSEEVMSDWEDTAIDVDIEMNDDGDGVAAA